MFNDLVMNFQPYPYLADIDKQDKDRLQVIIRQRQKAKSVTENMKEDNQLGWIQRMGSIHNRAEEIVLSGLRYK